MPAWPTLKVPVLATLADELRYAPKAAVLRDIERVIETIGLIDEREAYPRSWIVFRITGYRGEPGTDVSAAELDAVPGAVLKAQLPRLVERLSAQSGISESDASRFAPLLTQAALCTAWRVDRKSVERYRKLGLLALRVRARGGRSVLVFPQDAVRAFERAHTPRLGKAGAFSRVDPAARSAISSRTKRLKTRTNLPLSQVAAHVAKKVGRSVSTVRRIAGPRQASRSDIKLADALANWDAGVGTGVIARQLGRTRGAAIHSLLTTRAARLRTCGVGTMTISGRTGASASLAQLDRTGTPITLSAHAEELILAPTLATLLASMRVRRTLERGQEANLVHTHHTCLALAGRVLGGPLKADDLDEAETALRLAALARLELVASQSTLVLESIETVAGDPERLEPLLIGEGIVRGVGAVGAAIDQYTPPVSVRRAIGGRLAAPVSVLLGKVLADWSAQRRGALQARDQRRATKSLAAVATPSWIDAACPWRACVWPRVEWMIKARAQVIGERLAANPDRKVFEARFGVAPDTRPQSVREIAGSLGLTRVRAAEAAQRVVRLGLETHA